MSCKMVDAMLDEHPYVGMWYSINRPYKVEPGPHIHPSTANDHVSLILWAKRLEKLPKAYQPPLDKECVLSVLRQRARERSHNLRR